MPINYYFGRMAITSIKVYSSNTKLPKEPYHWMTISSNFFERLAGGSTFLQANFGQVSHTEKHS